MNPIAKLKKLHKDGIIDEATLQKNIADIEVCAETRKSMITFMGSALRDETNDRDILTQLWETFLKITKI